MPVAISPSAGSGHVKHSRIVAGSGRCAAWLRPRGPRSGKVRIISLGRFGRTAAWLVCPGHPARERAGQCLPPKAQPAPGNAQAQGTAAG